MQIAISMLNNVNHIIYMMRTIRLENFLVELLMLQLQVAFSDVKSTIVFYGLLV